MCVCVARGSAGGCRGGPAWAEADAPAFLPLGPRRVAHTGPPSLLVTGRTPVTLRNSAPGLPCRLGGEEPASAGDTGRFPGREDPTCLGATKPHTPKDKACAPEPGAASSGGPRPWSPRSTAREATHPPGSQGRAQAAAETQNGQSKQTQPCSKRSAAQTRPGKAGQPPRQPAPGQADTRNEP